MNVEYLAGRPNPWRVTLTYPISGGTARIHTRISAADESAARALAFERFARTLARADAGGTTLATGRPA
jgi:hypothetical protein